MEAEYFKDVVRAQLTTAATKPCTFFGTEVSSDKRVFGKGPYPSKDDAEVAVKVSAIKKCLLPGVKHPEIELVELIPNGMVDCQFGYRTKCDIDKPHWFQVTRDVMPNETVWPPEFKMRSSQKAWPDAVQVVDWSMVKHYSHVEYNRSYSKSIYKTNPTGAFQFASNIFASWVIGAGADLALSNFLVDNADGSVMQVDNDVWFHNDWWITDTRACSTRSKAYDHFKKFVEANFDDFFDTLSDNFKKHEVLITSIVGKENALVMEKKIEALKADWSTAHLHWDHINIVKDVSDAIELAEEHAPVVGTKRKACSGDQSEAASAKVQKVELSDDDEDVIPEKIPLVRQVAIPPIIERDCKAFTSDNDIYIGESSAAFEHEKDPWGFSVALRKSDLQKAIRRGNFRQAMVAFFSCYNLSRIYTEDQNAKSIRTNMINRLCVCAFEDVGVANTRLVTWTCIMLENILDMLKNGKRPNVVYMENHIENLLATVIYQLCISKKTRIQSHMSHAYAMANQYISINQFGLDWNQYPKGISDPNYIREFEKNHNLAWSHSRYAFNPAIYNAWKRLLGNNRNAVIRYIFVALHFTTRNMLSFDDVNQSNHSVIKVPERYKLKMYYENKIKLDPMECSYDMHVSGGKTNEEKIKFRKYGAMVENQCIKFYNPNYEKIYQMSNL